jgi:hypothetical protein
MLAIDISETGRTVLSSTGEEEHHLLRALTITRQLR